MSNENKKLFDINSQVECIYSGIPPCQATNYLYQFSSFSKNPIKILVDVPSNITLDKTLAHKVTITRSVEGSNIYLADYLCPLGKVINQDVYTSALLSSQGFSDTPFSKTIIASLPKDDYKIPDEEISKRRDFRDAPIFTIDPETARDLDDAISCELVEEAETFEKSLFKLSVHIADVSHFIPVGSELDIRASKQVSTVYLVQKAIHLLPETLSCNLCSLNEHCDRLSFGCEWLMYGNGDMEKQKVWFGKAVINSKARLHYSVAQEIIDGKHDDIDPSSTSIGVCPVIKGFGPQIVNSVKYAAKLADKLRQQRIKLGMIYIHAPQLSFKFDQDNNPSEFEPYPISDANHTIEEFMLMANNLVAQRMLSTFPAFSIIRNHRGFQNIEAYNTFLKTAGINYVFSVSQPFSVSYEGLIKAVKKTKGLSPSDAQTVSSISLACIALEKAYYNISCAFQTAEGLVHKGIATPVYMHFTSPIRRYPDLVCHRLLFQALELERNNIQLEGITHGVIYKRRIPFYGSITLPDDMGPNKAILAKAHSYYNYTPVEKAVKLSKSKLGSIEVLAEEIAGIEHLMKGIKMNVIDESTEEITNLAKSVDDKVMQALEAEFEKASGMTPQEFKEATEYFTNRYLMAKSVGDQSVYFAICSLFIRKNLGFIDYNAYYVNYDGENESISFFIPKLSVLVPIPLNSIPCEAISNNNGIINLTGVDTGKGLIPDHLIHRFEVERQARQNTAVEWEDTPLFKRSASQKQNEALYEETADLIECDYNLTGLVGKPKTIILRPMDRVSLLIRAEINPTTNLPFLNVIFQ